MFKKLKKWQAAKKTKLIYKLGYQYFYDNFQPQINGVHIPDFLQQQQRKDFADCQTKLHITQIIKNKALDRCYKSALKYERKLMANKLRLQIKRLLHA